MQSEIFQAFICYNFDDYGLQLMKTPNSKLEYCEKVFISVSHNHQNYNKYSFEISHFACNECN